MLTVFSWPITLVNNQTIYWNGFLNKMTCNILISSGMTTWFSKNLGKISRSLSFFFKKYLEYLPLKVSVGSGSLNILQNTWGEREIGEWYWIWIIRWFGIYFLVHQETNSLQSKKSGMQPTREISDVQITSFWEEGDE